LITAPLTRRSSARTPKTAASATPAFFPLLNGGELAIVYCFVFLYFWVAGGGEWSLDRLRTPASSSALSPSRA
jgi:uncharacterized membrane protein YphA (DoxX/SURF4 family)